MLLFKMQEAFFIGAIVTFYVAGRMLAGTMDDINTDKA